MSEQSSDAEMKALRRRAESILERGLDPDAAVLRGADLNHELHVAHQELLLQTRSLRETEVRLRDALAHAEALFDQAPCALLWIDDQLHIARANRRAAELLGGVRDGALVGALHPDERATAARFLARVTVGHESATMVRIMREAAPLACHLRATRFEGEDQRSMLVMLEPMNAYVELAERRTLLEAAVNQSNQGVMITTPAGPDSPPRIVYVNDALCRMSARGRQALIGRPPSILHGAEAEPAERARLNEALRAGVPAKVRLARRDAAGDARVVEVHVSPIFDTQGRLQSIVWTLADVTREVGETRRREHAQRLEAVGTLAGGVAHDFNNLLTVIQSLAELGRLEGEGNTADLFGDILDATQRASALSRRLLAFARNDAAPVRRVELRVALDEIVALARRLVPENIAIELRHAERAIALSMNPTHLEQIVLNLVTNARDAIGDGPGHIMLIVEPDDGAEADPPLDPGPYVRIDAIDDGPGIPAELRPDVFLPFVTSKPEHLGTGLGLAMVSDITRRYGGGTVLGPSNAPTRVSVFLPIAPDADGGQTRPAGSVQAPKRRLLDVVVVEDDPAVRDAIQRTLAAHGHRVRAFADALQGLASIDVEPTDVLVTDVVMPGMSGVELAERAQRVDDALGIVFVSGYVGGEMRDRPLRPRERFLSKPFTADDLFAVLAELG